MLRKLPQIIIIVITFGARNGKKGSNHLIVGRSPNSIIFRIIFCIFFVEIFEILIFLIFFFEIFDFLKFIFIKKIGKFFVENFENFIFYFFEIFDFLNFFPKNSYYLKLDSEVVKKSHTT